MPLKFEKRSVRYPFVDCPFAVARSSAVGFVEFVCIAKRFGAGKSAVVAVAPIGKAVASGVAVFAIGCSGAALERLDNDG